MKIIQLPNKEYFQCEMCHNGTLKKFLWESWFGGNEKEICEKCAKREAGSKHLNRIKYLNPKLVGTKFGNSK